MQGLELYNKVRVVPSEAKKAIGAGRLKGMTDINPMWRIKCLTEQFGPCGLGWSYEITNQWIEEGSENQKVAFTNINLYVKYGEEWSRAIPGTGGSSFIAKESKGPYTSDECYKMALTDAISVACKSLGIGADVYWDKDKTKYDAKTHTEDSGTKVNSNTKNSIDKVKVDTIRSLAQKKGIDEAYICKYRNCRKFEELTLEGFTAAMDWLNKQIDKAV